MKESNYMQRMQNNAVIPLEKDFNRTSSILHSSEIQEGKESYPPYSACNKQNGDIRAVTTKELIQQKGVIKKKKKKKDNSSISKDQDSQRKTPQRRDFQKKVLPQ